MFSTSPTFWLVAFLAEQLLLLAAAGPSTARGLWPGARLLVEKVDGGLEVPAAAVLDELEQKTFVHVVRGGSGGLVLRANTTGSQSLKQNSTQELCFDASGDQGKLRRSIAVAVLRALGVSPEQVAETYLDGSSDLLTRAEAGIVNNLYAPLVVPNISAQPAVLEVGWLQLAQGFNSTGWISKGAGRDRQVVRGAMRLAQSLKAATGAQIVGAVPSFLASSNKAEVVLFGPTAAELVEQKDLPQQPRNEDLSAGIRRVTLHMRKTWAQLFAMGVPTFLDDGSALMLFASVGRLEKLKIQCSSTDVRIVAAAQAAWPRERGAVLALPTFVATRSNVTGALRHEKAGGNMDVLVLREVGQPAATKAATKAPQRRPPAVPPVAARRLVAKQDDSGLSLGWGLVVLWMTIGVSFLLWRLKSSKRRGSMSREEWDLERMVHAL